MPGILGSVGRASCAIQANISARMSGSEAASFTKRWPLKMPTYGAADADRARPRQRLQPLPVTLTKPQRHHPHTQVSQPTPSNYLCHAALVGCAVHLLASVRVGAHGASRRHQIPAIVATEGAMCSMNGEIAQHRLRLQVLQVALRGGQPPRYVRQMADLMSSTRRRLAQAKSPYGATNVGSTAARGWCPRSPPHPLKGPSGAISAGMWWSA